MNEFLSLEGGHYFLTYKNRFNEVKAYVVEVIAVGQEEFDVYDLRELKTKTFKATNILSVHDSYEAAEQDASKLQKFYEPVARNKTGRTYANREGKFEVCFTGFSNSEKSGLVERAKSEGMFVRTDISNKLALLVCGSNAGPSKLAKAIAAGVPRVFGADGFEAFLNSGECVE